MKTAILFPTLTLLAGLALGVLIFRLPPVPTPPLHRLSLEQILSIKELHLVRHTYTDILFLHKENDKNKPVRAIAQVPVVVTAYLNLKEIEIVRENDTIKQVVLPRARLNDPNYQLNKMIIRETRSFQVYAGQDQYPAVGRYVQAVIAERIDSLRKAAIALRIISQAEEEGKQYVENLLQAAGRSDVSVQFATDKKPVAKQ